MDLRKTEQGGCGPDWQLLLVSDVSEAVAARLLADSAVSLFACPHQAGLLTSQSQSQQSADTTQQCSAGTPRAASTCQGDDYRSQQSAGSGTAEKQAFSHTDPSQLRGTHGVGVPLRREAQGNEFAALQNQRCEFLAQVARMHSDACAAVRSSHPQRAKTCAGTRGLGYRISDLASTCWAGSHLIPILALVQVIIALCTALVTSVALEITSGCAASVADSATNAGFAVQALRGALAEMHRTAGCSGEDVLDSAPAWRRAVFSLTGVAERVQPQQPLTAVALLDLVATLSALDAMEE
jgi:hypothetical protein